MWAVQLEIILLGVARYVHQECPILWAHNIASLPSVLTSQMALLRVRPLQVLLLNLNRIIPGSKPTVVTVQIYLDCSPLTEANELSSNQIAAPWACRPAVLIDGSGKTINLRFCPRYLHSYLHESE